MRETEELLELCRHAGSSLAISQGAGGNASVKRPRDGSMWIKSSGCRLSDVSEGEGYLRMLTPSSTELSKSVAGLEHTAANRSMAAYMQSLVLDSTSQRPSMETWFHAALDRVVLHTHPIYANAFACMEGGGEELTHLLSEAPAVISYHAPGHRLGEAVDVAVEDHRRHHGTAPAQVLLENHGLITASSTVAETIGRSDEVLQAGRRFFGPLSDSAFAKGESGAELDAWAAGLQLALRRGVGSHLVARASRFALLRGPHINLCAEPEPIVPDDVICNGPAVLSCNADDSHDEFIRCREAQLSHSAAIRVRDLGFVFVAAGLSMVAAMEEQLLANLLVRGLIARRGQCRRLQSSEARTLLAMESEKHRRSMLAHGGSSCRS